MDFLVARKHMVENQLMPNKITDKSIKERFLNVPREFFVQSADIELAYSDGIVAIGKGRTMLSPMVQARILQELKIQKTDKVMIVAAGTGYLSVIISPLCKEVFTIENETSLRDVAIKGRTTGKCDNIHIKAGKPEDGLAKDAPFDKILINTPVAFIPEKIVKQLKDGGKLIAIVENDSGILEVTRYSKNGKTIVGEFLFNTKGTVLDNFAKEEKFIF